MDTSVREQRTLTELDHVRLERLAADRALQTSHAEPAALTELLGNADLMPSKGIPPDLVTMYSQVMLRDVENGSSLRLTVTYPGDAEPSAGFVSVLSPAGTALLGLRVGDIARWRTPGGERVAEVTALLFQPEASGDYTL
jgi:regulator of nucleoside diphosphate kinase